MSPLPHRPCLEAPSQPHRQGCRRLRQSLGRQWHRLVHRSVRLDQVDHPQVGEEVRRI